MLKVERQKYILELINEKEFVKVTDITKDIQVTEMTVRRDFKELEDQGLITRVHGGAVLVDKSEFNPVERSHQEKRTLNLEEKKEIAQTVAGLIKNDDTVFIGPGTTLELVYQYLEIEKATIVTNSLYVLNKFKHDDRFELILLGGKLRHKTGSFYGTIANSLARDINVQKAFVAVNALNHRKLYTANIDEGLTLEVILKNAEKRYIVADGSKLNKKDFYSFYKLDEDDTLILNKEIPEKTLLHYSSLANVIQ